MDENATIRKKTYRQKQEGFKRGQMYREETGNKRNKVLYIQK